MLRMSRQSAGFRRCEQRRNELLRIELAKILDALPDSHEADGKVQLACYRKYDSASGRSVELSQDHTGHVQPFHERPCLCEPVLTGDGVEDEQCFVWSPL